MNGNKIILRPGAVFGTFPWLKDYLEMFKLHLCLYISLSSVLGHVAARNEFSVSALVLGGIVLVLALGSAVLNNIQDRYYDLEFPRTVNRSLPQKRVPVLHASVISACMIFTGLAGLYCIAGRPCVIAGFAAVAAYNGLYTPLKKKTLMAIIPGAVSGMLPVLIGWTAAGGSVFNSEITMIMGVLGLWQIPHFFIILLKTRGCRQIHPAARRFPCFTRYFSLQQIQHQVLIWTSLYSLAIFLLLLNGFIDHLWIAGLCAFNALGILLPMTALWLMAERFKLSYAFTAINLSMFGFFAAGICDKILI